MNCKVSLHRWIALAACAASLLPTPARAGSGSIASLPMPTKKITTGLNLKIDSEWAEGNGYRPITISIAPLGGGAAPADRTLDVTLWPRSYRGGTAMPTVSTTITLEQGQTIARKTIGMPQSNTWNSMRVTTYEDGRRCEDLSEEVGFAWNGNNYWSEAAPTMLFIDSDVPLGTHGTRMFPATATANNQRPKRPERLPDIRALNSIFIMDYSGNVLAAAGIDPTGDLDDNGLLRVVDSLDKIEFLPPANVPTTWLHLTSIDLIFVSMSDLRVLSGDPERWEAVCAWLSTGSTLCVYDVGEDFGGVPELERLFELDPADESGRENSVRDFLARGWNAPNVAAYANEVFAIRNAQWNNRGYGQPQAIGSSRNNANATSRTKDDDPRPFLFRRVEHGTLVAFAAENPFPGKREEWCWLFNTLNYQDWMWYQRHGMSRHRENPQYWDLLIPGVGSAPVNSFLVLISLFVVAIGPVNYFMLQRRRKLYLLLLTVPLGAGVITAALLLYALVSDGLGVRARARSLTRIDQTSGRTVSWSRQSYYAGLAPSAGMSFPVDTAIYAIDHRPTGRYGQTKDMGRRIRWSSAQRLTQGFLNSRSTAQMMVIESRKTDLGIDVVESAGGAAPRVTNRLGVEIEQLVLCSSDKQTFACVNLPAGQSVQLHAIDAREFPKQWNELVAAARPQFPVGFDPNQVENAAAIFGNNYYGWNLADAGLQAPTTSTSILERGIQSVGKLKPDAMRPRSYIGIVRRAPNASLGIKSVTEEASFHVVTGRW